MVQTLEFRQNLCCPYLNKKQMAVNAKIRSHIFATDDGAHFRNSSDTHKTKLSVH
jgi:hypothetical protein